MSDNRLKSVYEAASFLFITKGFANTQVSEIAKRANIATGTVYNLFTSKKAILQLVLHATFSMDYLDSEISLPVKEFDIEQIVDELSQVIDLVLTELAGKSSFVDLFATLFDYTARYQVAFNTINNNQAALERVEERYRVAVNQIYVLFENKLMEAISNKEIRDIDMPALHIRNIIEIITWWSMYLPYREPGLNVPAGKAKEIAVDVLTHAYSRKES